jgi:hypothetical protein
MVYQWILATVFCLLSLATGCTPKSDANALNGPKYENGRKEVFSDKAFYENNPIFTPVAKINGDIVEFHHPNGTPTKISYDINKLVDVDSFNGKSFNTSTFKSADEREKAISIINQSIIQAFRDGYYADYRSHIDTPAWNSVMNDIAIGKPVKVDLRFDALPTQLYEVPIIYQNKIFVIVKVAEYADENKIIATSLMISRNSPSELTGDGIVPVYSMSSAMKQAISASAVGKFGTQGIGRILAANRVKVITDPVISDSGSVWQVQTEHGFFLINENGSLFRERSGFLLQSNSRLPVNQKIKVDPL